MQIIDGHVFLLLVSRQSLGDECPSLLLNLLEMLVPSEAFGVEFVPSSLSEGSGGSALLNELFSPCTLTPGYRPLRGGGPGECGIVENRRGRA